MRIKTRRRPRKNTSRKNKALSKKIKRRRIVWKGGTNSGSSEQQVVATYKTSDGYTCVKPISSSVGAMSNIANTTAGVTVNAAVPPAANAAATAATAANAANAPVNVNGAANAANAANAATPAAGNTLVVGPAASGGTAVDDTTKDNTDNIDSEYTNRVLKNVKNSNFPTLPIMQERNGDGNYTNTNAIIIVEILRNLLNKNKYLNANDISNEADFKNNFYNLIKDLYVNVIKFCPANDSDCIIREICKLFELMKLSNMTVPEIAQLYENNNGNIDTLAVNVFKEKNFTNPTYQQFKVDIIKQIDIPEKNKIAIILAYCEIRISKSHVDGVNLGNAIVYLFKTDTNENLQDYIRNYFLLVIDTNLIVDLDNDGFLNILRDNDATSQMLELLQKSAIFDNGPVAPTRERIRLLLNLSKKIVSNNSITEKVQTMKIIFELLQFRIGPDNLINLTEISDEKFNNIISAITKATKLILFTDNKEITKQIALLVVVLLKFPNDFSEKDISDYILRQTKRGQTINIQTRYLDQSPNRPNSTPYNIFV